MIATQDVEELGELVQARLPKEPSNSSDSWIFLDLECPTVVLAGSRRLTFARYQFLDKSFVNRRVVAGVHGPEFQDLKDLAIVPDSFLPK